MIDYHDGEHDDPPGASPIEVVDSLYAPVVEHPITGFGGYRVSVRVLHHDGRELFALGLWWNLATEQLCSQERDDRAYLGAEPSACAG